MGVVSALGIGVGIILIIVGVILLIIGTIYYGIKVNNGEEVSAWIWIMVAIGIFLMILGLLAVIGGAFSSAAHKHKKEVAEGEIITTERTLCCN